MYCVCDRKSWNVIVAGLTYEQALLQIEEFERDDIENGCFSADAYEIVPQDVLEEALRHAICD